MSAKVLNLKSVNPLVKNFEYAVRGEIAIRAEEIRNQLITKPNSLPFQNVVSCNIGNPQQLGQRPITFFRQVASLIEYPNLLDSDLRALVSQIYPQDAIERAQSLLESVGGSIGAYSHSQGIPKVREHVAQFIESRDGYPSNPNDIFLTAGASLGVQTILQTLISHANVGVMIPIPQYPLYTASIALYNGKAVSYYLDEEENWSTHLLDLKKSLENARQQDIDVRALCVINPGNPTGQCLKKENMEQIIDFCSKERLVLLADEVYQTNIYSKGLPFHSFKKVLKSMGSAYEHVELISFHSVSKGQVGECGRRGGYFECTGIDPNVKELFYKMASVSLCPPVQGQIMVDLQVKPPVPGDVSYPLYKKEMEAIHESLKRRAERLAAAFNELENVTCNPAEGAMYLFPQIRFSQKLMHEAEKIGKLPDELYCRELLDATGVCVVAGSGFRQKTKTWHFRSTFLPPESQLDAFIERIKEFHGQFMNKYRD